MTTAEQAEAAMELAVTAERIVESGIAIAKAQGWSEESGIKTAIMAEIVGLRIRVAKLEKAQKEHGGNEGIGGVPGW